MRILLYNFLQPEELGAGGVGTYLRNIAAALADHDHQVITLSSGQDYDLFRGTPRLEFGPGDQQVVVVNSPAVAPALYSFGDLETYLSSDELDSIPEQLKHRYGDIDVFHFQNIEGLTRSFFYQLRRTFPRSRILYSIHNYHLMCARVTLWYQDRLACRDYRDGVACTMCEAPVFDVDRVRDTLRLRTFKRKHPLAGRLVSSALPLLKRIRGFVRVRGQAINSEVGASATSGPSTYAAFRHANIALCNEVFDQILSVSGRTRKVMVDLGAPADKIDVSYIGTAYKEMFLKSDKISDVGSGVHLAYIGYMTRDKGFYFMLEGLEQMSADVAANISVTIAARNVDYDAYTRVQRLANRFREVRYFDGYTHDNLDTVLQDVNLGLIPVLWEDNLPQTAIELVSRGIPILCSDRGGAQEIAGKSDFIFPAGGHDQFIDRIVRIGCRDIALGDFWAGTLRLFSMDEHVADLERHYRATARIPASPFPHPGAGAERQP